MPNPTRHHAKVSPKRPPSPCSASPEILAASTCKFTPWVWVIQDTRLLFKTHLIFRKIR